MVRVDFRRPQNRVSYPSTAQVVRNFSGLQKNQIEPDKQEFADMALVENMIHKGANAELRNGMQKLKQVEDLLGVVIHETPTENYLYAYVKDGATDSKLVEVDRETGDTTDKVTGIDGQGAPSYCSINGVFYFANGGEAITKYDRTTDTALGVTTDITYKFVATDGSRLWYVMNDANGEDVLGFSQKSVTGDITALTGGGTALTRGGFSESTIIRFTSLTASGEVIMASSDQSIEFFRIPDFESGGYTTFPDDISIRIKGSNIDNLGIESQNNVLVVGGFAYVVSKDAVLYKIPMGSNNYKEIRDNQLQMDDFRYDQVAMGYDQRKNLLLISCRKGAANDRVICYNVLEQNFSLFTNIFASQFTNDADNVYYVGRNNYIIEALQEDSFDDDGLKINWKVRTQMSDFGTLDFYKVLKDFFANIEFNENFTLSTKIYADRGVNSGFSASYTNETPLTKSAPEFLESPQFWGLGLLGVASFDSEAYSTEQLRTDQKIHKTGVRFEAEVSGSNSTFTSLRGIGFTGQITGRRSNTLIYS